MGQKTNPNIYQLGKTKKWSQPFCEKKHTEFAKYSENNIALKQFFFKHFSNNGLQICEYNAFYANNKLTIFATYIVTKQTVDNFISDNEQKSLNEIDKKKKVFFYFKKLSKNYRHRVLMNKTSKINSFTKTTTKIKTQKKKVFTNIKRLKGSANLFKKFLTKRKEKAKRIFDQKFKNYEFRQKFWKKEREGGFKKKNKFFKKAKTWRKNTNGSTYFQNKKIFEIMKESKAKTFYEINNESFIKKTLEILNIYTNSKFTIVLNVKQLNQNIFFNLNKVKFENFKKKFDQSGRFKHERFFNEGLRAVVLFLEMPHLVEFFSNYIAAELQNHKKQHSFLNFIKDALGVFVKLNLFKHNSGILIKIKGRFNGAPRSKTRIINVGENFSIISAKSKICYAESTSFSTNGTFGIKVWTSSSPTFNVSRTKKNKI